jgi:hypothetical protein
MAESKFSLGDYVEVKDRIRLFYEAHPDGRLTTAEVRVSVDDDTPRVIVHAQAFRTADDPHPADGWSWMVLPGKTPYTAGSELENTETSAWGRAIGALGIGIAGSIASANEVRAKAGESEAKPDPAGETVRPLGPITRTGAVAKGQGRHSDLEWREQPDGSHRIGFLLEVGDGKARPQVVIDGELGSAIFTTGLLVVGMKLTVEGDVFEVHAEKRKTMYRIHAARIVTDDWTMPADLPPDEVAEIEALPWDVPA